ncbi:alcohol dehydrogenase [Stutzerimonas kirkiae]|uniref:Alcohol dehydrogenase n=1 Tax=Stutzerimonas kirkiae TaxID=2211392 RepID=A0A4Q9RC00_9GAMM|nr:cytochrome c [Stutzerimonas kirkiae]TBU98308.1 alcohol dehydrogenase [Stutzerimonas kirkiae]TBV01944.1 alcohol dehydrogenase [Stutzerimonas kirkiae]
MKTAALLGVALFSLGIASLHAADGADAYELVEKGRYLAVLGDCTACHTVPGKPFLAGGGAVETPFGILLGANITPDRNTGIGKWRFEDFQATMSRGHARGGKRLYGAMPFTAYTKVSEADNRALWAYLRTLDPVENPVQTNQLPFPFNIRLSLLAWNWLNFEQGEYQPDPQRSEQWNRGAYLVQGLGHCGTCHTPKNLLGGDQAGQYLRGANLQGWVAPDITANAHQGIGKWSDEELIQYLKTGANRYDIASGPMAEAVEHSLQHWRDADLRAVAVYLRSLGGERSDKPTALPADAPAMRTGAAIYSDRCAACHIGSGEGIEQLFPKLAGAPLVNASDPTSLIRVVLAGSRAGATDAAPTAPAMPSFAWNLDDRQVADVVSYIRNSWGNAAAAVSPGEVAKLRQSLAE